MSRAHPFGQTITGKAVDPLRRTGRQLGVGHIQKFGTDGQPTVHPSSFPSQNSPSKSVPARRGHAKILLLTRKDYMASIKLNNHVLCEETDKQPVRLATRH